MKQDLQNTHLKLFIWMHLAVNYRNLTQRKFYEDGIYNTITTADYCIMLIRSDHFKQQNSVYRLIQHLLFRQHAFVKGQRDKTECCSSAKHMTEIPGWERRDEFVIYLTYHTIMHHEYCGWEGR